MSLSPMLGIVVTKGGEQISFSEEKTIAHSRTSLSSTLIYYLGSSLNVASSEMPSLNPLSLIISHIIYLHGAHLILWLCFCGNFIPFLLDCKSTLAGQELQICSFHLEIPAQSLAHSRQYIVIEWRVFPSDFIVLGNRDPADYLSAAVSSFPGLVSAQRL